MGSLCVLVACALAGPSFVLGADQPPVDRNLREVVAPPSADPLATSESSATALDQAPADQTAPAIDTTVLPPNGDLVVTLPWGSEAGEVGLLEAAEGLARGPEALAVAPDGRIAVLDSVNGRLLLLDPTGGLLGTAPIPLRAPRFLAVDDERLYVLDCDTDRRLVAFAWNGTETGAVALPDLDDVVTGLFATAKGPCMEISHETAVLLTQTDSAIQTAATQPSQPRPTIGRTIAGRPLSRGLGRVVRVTFEPGGNARIELFDLDTTTLKAERATDSIPVLAAGRAIEHLVSVDGDGAGGMIIGARLLKAEVSGGREASLALTRLVAAEVADPGNDGTHGVGQPVAGPNDRTSGARETDPNTAPNALAATVSDEAETISDILLLIDSPFVYLGQPYVVAPDGRIFQPWGNEAGYSILVHSFAEVEEVQS